MRHYRTGGTWMHTPCSGAGRAAAPIQPRPGTWQPTAGLKQQRRWL